MIYKKIKEKKLVVREQHDPIVEAILGDKIKYTSDNFKQLEKDVRELRRIIRNM